MICFGGGIKLERFRNFCLTGVNGVFSIASAAVAVLILFNISERYVNIAHFNTGAVFIFILFIIAVTALLYFICTKSSKPLKRFFSVHPLRAMTISMSIIIVLQMLIAREVYTPIGWDSGYLVTIAGNLGPGWVKEQDLYLTWYPNNITLTFIFKVFYKLVGSVVSNAWLACVILSILAVDTGIVFISLTAKKIFGLKAYYIALWFCILSAAFNPMNTVPYSDTMAFPFTAGFLYAVSVILTSKNKLIKSLFSFLAGAILIMGYFIKPTVLIVGIASLICICIYIRKPKFNQLVSFILCASLLAAGAASGVLINKLARPFVYVNVPTKQEQYDLEVPMTHFIMMGLNENPDGYYGYFPEDSANTRSILGKAEKTEYHKEVIKQRLSDFGVSGFLKHCVNKAVWISTDGTFYYGGEGHFHGNIPQKQNGIGGFLQNFTYTDTNIYQKYFANYMQAVWLLAAVGMALNIFNKRKNCTEPQNTLRFIAQLSLIGLITFLMLFEARSRYIFLYLPYFVLLAATGYQTLIKKSIF